MPAPVFVYVVSSSLLRISNKKQILNIEAILLDGTANLATATCGVLVTVIMSAPFPYGGRRRALEKLPNSSVMEH
jgi:hypothetical protein